MAALVGFLILKNIFQNRQIAVVENCTKTINASNNSSK